MKMYFKYFLSIMAALLIAPATYAEEVTEGFESVTLVNADTWGRATELSNGWKIQGGYIHATSRDTYDYSFWSTAYNGSSKSLTAQAGSSNSAYVIIPVLLTGDVTFYYRKTSSDSRSAGKVYAYKVTESNGTYTIGTRIFMDESATSSWQKCTSIRLTEPTMIAFKMVRAAMDDVVYNTASLEPHEHDYASEWSMDENEHWHACTSEVGICDAKKIDVAAHDGLTCSVCGYKMPGVETFPWLEDFNGISSGIPAGWDNSEGTTTTASYKWNYYSKAVRFDSYNNRSGITNVLATPLLYIPSTGVYELKFKVKNPTGGNYEVKIAEYGSAERTTLFDNLTNIADWTEKTASLEAYAGKAVKIYFCGTSNWGSGDAYLYLDDVTVKESIAHNHNYAEEWSHDYNNHWHACLSEVGECSAPKADFAAHTLNAEGICTVCGYDQPYMENFENGIPASWTNNGWSTETPSYGNGTKMAYAGRYAAGNTLTTPLLYAKAGDEMSVEALLPWDDETLTMEYSLNNGETWNVAFSKTPAANNSLETITWTAPEEGEYLLRFSGRYNYIDNFLGFKLVPTLTISSSVKYATMCYPAAVTLPEGVTAYIATQVNENSVHLEPFDGNLIPAYEPVVLYSEKGATVKLGLAANAREEEIISGTTEGNILKGCTSATLIENGTNTFCLAKKNDEVGFYPLSDGIKIPAFRAFLQLENAASISGLRITIDGGSTTGIQALPEAAGNKLQTTEIYNLSGQRMAKMQKGINIINGTKVLY